MEMTSVITGMFIPVTRASCDLVEITAPEDDIQKRWRNFKIHLETTPVCKKSAGHQLLPADESGRNIYPLTIYQNTELQE